MDKQMKPSVFILIQRISATLSKDTECSLIYWVIQNSRIIHLLIKKDIVLHATSMIFYFYVIYIYRYVISRE